MWLCKNLKNWKVCFFFKTNKSGQETRNTIRYNQVFVAPDKSGDSMPFYISKIDLFDKINEYFDI